MTLGPRVPFDVFGLKALGARLFGGRRSFAPGSVEPADAGRDEPGAVHAPSLSATLAALLGLSAAQMEQTFMEVGQSGTGLVPQLLKTHKIDEAAGYAALSEALGVPYLEELELTREEAEHLRGLPFSFLKRNLVLPHGSPGAMRLAVADPFLPELADDVRRLFPGQALELVLAAPVTIVTALNHAFGQAESDDKQIHDDVNLDDFSGPPPESLATADLLDETSNAPVIRLVNQLLTQAVKDLCSDIHIEPYQNALKIRFRLDGVLYDIKSMDKRWHAPVVSHIKIRSRLDIAERRLPQDGSFDIRLGNRNVDIRVSVFPTKFGERLVLRLLEKNSRVLSLEELGLSPDNLATLKNLVLLPHGIILVTGPTGSGKTTTLYATINFINSSEKNILTIEDPVEYQVDGVGQMQVNAKIDLTFANGLRSILRQDPDVILVGEIRDFETAQIACQAALTGHLVLSTLHTNDAASAVTRLVDMAIEPYMVCSVVRALMAQRLVRVLCPRCREAFTPGEEDLIGLGRAGERLVGHTIYRHKGCSQCMHTGYHGRTSIHEVLVLDEEMAELVLHTSEAGRIRQLAMERGMSTLRDDGLKKIQNGVTTIEEVIRATVV